MQLCLFPVPKCSVCDTLQSARLCVERIHEDRLPRRPDKRWLYQTEGSSELIPTSGGEEEEEYSHSPTYVILNLRKFDFT